jgi:uncharacterized membrane protein HdeD (DUF308 family)
MRMANDEGNRSVERLADRWWAFVVRGAVTVAVGILTLGAPEGRSSAFVYLWGAYAIGDGLFAAIHAASARCTPASRGWLLLRGALGVGCGLVVLWPGISELSLLGVLGGWALLGGIADIGAAFHLRDICATDWVVGVSGVLSIAFGVLLIVWPFEGPLELVRFVGAYAIFFGALLVFLGVGVRRFRHPEGGATPAAGTPGGDLGSGEHPTRT